MKEKLIQILKSKKFIAILLFVILEVFNGDKIDEFVQYIFMYVTAHLINSIIAFITYLFNEPLRELVEALVKDNTIIKGIEAILVYLLAIALKKLKDKYKK